MLVAESSRRDLRGVFNNNGIGLEHLTDSGLSLDYGKIVEAIVIEPINLLRISFAHVSTESITRPANRIFPKVVIREAGTVP